MESKNGELLRDFALYCDAHPEQRFWQALRNWAQVSAIHIQREHNTEQVDTFYFEAVTR